MSKIVFVINYITNNGPSNMILNIMKNMDKEQYNVFLVTLFEGNDGHTIAALKNYGVKVLSCKTLSRAKCIMGQDKEFQDILIKEQFNIIHSHGLIPDILTSRSKTSAKKIATIHNNMFEDYVQTYGKVKAAIFIKIHLNALKKMDCCVGCSQSVYRIMRNYLSNVTYVRNGVEPKITKHIVTRAELDIPEEAVVFVYSGVLNARKNIAFLIDQFATNHQDEEFLLVLGDGPEKEKCMQLSDSHVKLIGFSDDPAAYYNISDIYTSSSKSEGFSVSILEALSCGLGLFVSDIPSHREVFGMEKELYLGEMFSISGEGRSFKTAINALLMNKNKISKQAIRQFQYEKLSDKAMEKEYEIVYRKVMERGKV